ncbi:MAG: MBL fold metallo-hydrolase [Acidobacteria bacterium]|nr:MBL fold metallo-hydrolase [Acidobacteriota bacterium]
MTRRALVLGLILAGGVLAAAAAQQPPLGKIEKVADGLYRIPGQGGATAVYLAGNGVVLVDTKLANNGQGILDQVRTVTDKPVTMIINTHTHGDHTGSNMFFPANVEIVTHENTKANMEKMPVYQDPANKNGMPDRTYKDRLTLLGGNDAIDLYYFGPAHTNGDTFVVFRNRRVLHAGDVFANTAQPFIDVSNGGSGLAYGETIGKAAAAIKNIDTVITGHTDVKKWQDFVDYGEFNRLFLQHARASLKAGRTPEQAMATLQLPAKFKGYTLTGGRGGPGGNFNVIYQELQKSQ